MFTRVSLLPAACVAAALLAAGCGGDAEPTSTAPPAPASNAPPGAPQKAAAAKPAVRKPMAQARPKKKSKAAAPKDVAAASDPSDGPNPRSTTEVVMLGPRQDITVRPRSEREDRRFRVRPSPTGSYSRSFVTPSDSTLGPAPRPPEGFEAASGSRTNDDGWPLEIVGETDGRVMRFVPGGTFRFGDRATAEVSPFYIDQFEVTLSDWSKYKSAAERRVASPANESDPGAHPATGLKLRDAVAYAEWAGKKLPTEVQWELAARGTRSLPNVWGEGPPLWTRPRTPGMIGPVGAYPADRSVYGVFDLAGNAREWTLDGFEKDVFEEADGSRDFAGPKRPKSPGERVVRGSDKSFSASARAGVDASERSKTIGFRCVLPATR